MSRLIFTFPNGNDLCAYRTAIEAVGGELCTDPACADDCDGLLLPGGGDIDPLRYGQQPTAPLRLNPARESAEFALLDSFVAAGKPILGICLGMQMINVAFGGTLRQAIERHELGEEGHATRACGVLAELYGDSFRVNSYHRQAVLRTSDALLELQWAGDGIVEALRHRSLPIFGVQWHPERMLGGGNVVEGSLFLQYFVDLLR